MISPRHRWLIPSHLREKFFHSANASCIYTSTCTPIGFSEAYKPSSWAQLAWEETEAPEAGGWRPHSWSGADQTFYLGWMTSRGPGFSPAPALSAPVSHGGGRHPSSWVATMPSTGRREGEGLPIETGCMFSRAVVFKHAFGSVTHPPDGTFCRSPT